MFRNCNIRPELEDDQKASDVNTPIRVPLGRAVRGIAQTVDIYVSREASRRATKILVRFTDQRLSAEDLEHLVGLGGPHGGEIRPDEVASVKDLLALDESRIERNEHRVGVLKITKTKPQEALPDSWIEEQLAD
jgi:multidrug efflux pump subunit AcrB